MIAVAKCESGIRQYEKDGKVLRGRIDNRDVGLFQISEKYHAETAKDMGIDIYSVEGNIKYAKHLYEKNGLRDWSASRPCWEKET